MQLMLWWGQAVVGGWVGGDEVVPQILIVVQVAFFHAIYIPGCFHCCRVGRPVAGKPAAKMLWGWAISQDAIVCMFPGLDNS